MTAFELLREIEARGIRVLVRGDRISLRGADARPQRARAMH